MRVRAIILIVLVAFVIVGVPVVADLSSNNLQICDPSYPQSIMIPLYAYSPTPYVILPSSACGGVSGAWYIYQDHVNFTNIYFASLSNPGHTFGVGVQNANVTVTDASPPSPSSIFYNLNCVKGNTVYAWFYLPKGFVPSSITVTSGSSSYLINPNYFITSLSTFNSAPAPSVYYDQIDGIAEAKVICDPTTILWNIAPVSSSPGGQGGQNGGIVITTVSQTSSTTQNQTANQVPNVNPPSFNEGNLSILLYLVFLLIVVVYAAAYVERNTNPINKMKKRFKKWI